MRKILLLIVLTISFQYLHAEKALLGNLTVSPSIRIPAVFNSSITYDVNITDKNWNSTTPKQIIHASGSPKIDKNSYHIFGKIPLPSTKSLGDFDYSVKLLEDTKQQQKYQISLTLTPPKDYTPTHVIGSITIDEKDAVNGMLFVNDKRIVYPEKIDRSKPPHLLLKDNPKVEILGKYGVWKFEGVKEYSVQDNRYWKWNAVSLREMIKRSDDGKYRATINITFNKYLESHIGMPKETSAYDMQYLPKECKFGLLSFKYNADLPRVIKLQYNGETTFRYSKGQNSIYLLTECSPNPDGKLGEYEFIFPNQKATGNLSADSSNSAKVWQAKQSNGTTRKLHIVRIDIPRSDINGMLKIKNTNNAPISILAATSNNANLSPSTFISTFITPGDEYFPIEHLPLVEKDSVIDFSFLLDAPAGKYGFAKASGDTIVFENRPDTPVRFFGNNMTLQANFPEKEIAPTVADTYSRTGYNLCRFHFHDNLLVKKTNTGDIKLNSENIDKLDYFAAELKKRGVYFTTDLFMARDINKQMLEPEFQKLDLSSLRARKAVIMLSKNARENLKQYSKAVLTHVNPYTNLAWKDDPALISINIVNEGTMSSIDIDNFVPIFDKRFKKWASDNNIELNEKNKKFWRSKFHSTIHDEFYNDMKNFLRSLGVRAILTNENHMTSVPQSIRSENFDMVETHTYYGHPHFIERPWRMPTRLKNTSSTLERGSFSLKIGSMALKDAPFAVTEWNHIVSNVTAAEGAMIMGSYGAMQDWDILCRYTYRHAPHNIKPATMLYFDTDSIPTISLSERVASAMLLRKDAKVSKLPIPLIIPRDFLKEYNPTKAKLLDSLGYLYIRFSVYGKPMIIFADKNQKLNLPKGTKCVFVADNIWEDVDLGVPQFDAGASTKENIKRVAEILGKGLVDNENNRYTASTKQITIDAKKGALEISTQRTEAFSGKEGDEFNGKFVSFKLTKSWGAMAAISRDNKPLARSSRILLLHLSDIKNTNMRFSDEKLEIQLNHGSLPLLLRKAKAEVEFNSDLPDMKCYAISTTGKRLGEIEIIRKGGKSKIYMDTHGKYGATLAYELVREK